MGFTALLSTSAEQDRLLSECVHARSAEVFMSEAKLEAWLEESRSFPPSAEFAAQANAQPSIYDQATPIPSPTGAPKPIA